MSVASGTRILQSLDSISDCSDLRLAIQDVGRPAVTAGPVSATPRYHTSEWHRAAIRPIEVQHESIGPLAPAGLGDRRNHGGANLCWLPLERAGDGLKRASQVVNLVQE
jgi:hypothetical protein